MHKNKKTLFTIAFALFLGASIISLIYQLCAIVFTMTNNQGLEPESIISFLGNAAVTSFAAYSIRNIYTLDDEKHTHKDLITLFFIESISLWINVFVSYIKAVSSYQEPIKHIADSPDSWFRLIVLLISIISILTILIQKRHNKVYALIGLSSFTLVMVYYSFMYSSILFAGVFSYDFLPSLLITASSVIAIILTAKKEEF